MFLYRSRGKLRLPSMYSCQKKAGSIVECPYVSKRFASPIAPKRSMMPCSKKTAERRQYHSVQRECPTIPNTKMPQENSVIFGAIQEWGRTGASLIRLGPYRAGFCGISPPSESLWPIISGDSDFKHPRHTCRAHRSHTRASGVPRWWTWSQASQQQQSASAAQDSWPPQQC